MIAHDAHDALAEVAGAQAVHIVVVVQQAELQIGLREGDAQKFVADVAEFSVVFL